jgi:hypothetical protein
MGQIWSKLAKINRFSNFFDNFSHFSGRETVLNEYNKNETFSKKPKSQFFPILATFYELKITF